MVFFVGLVQHILLTFFVVMAISCTIACWAFGSVKSWKYKLTALVCLALCVLFIFAAVKLGVPTCFV